MTVAVFALLEVLDKEAACELVWVVSVVIGSLGHFAARWRRRTAVISVAALALALAWPASELVDPVVGPAIQTASGGSYRRQLLAAFAVGLSMIAVGTVRSSRRAA
jgi:hypothetical protein